MYLGLRLGLPMLARPPSSGGSSYPAGVVAASLQAKWDQKATVGLQTTPTKFFPTSTGSLPTGMTFDNFDVTNANTNLDGCTADTADWDLRDSKVQALNATNAIIRRSHIGYRVYSGRYLQMYDTSILEFIDSDLDGTGSGTNWPAGTVIGHGMISDVSGSTTKLTRCRVYGSPRTHGDIVGTFTCTDSYFECFGTYTSGDDHCESYKINQGVSTFTGCVFDVNDGGVNLGGLTGLLYLLALTGATTINFVNCIFNFPDSWGLPYTFQTSGDSGFPLVINVQGCAIKKGTTGAANYFLISGDVTLNDLGGNKDFVTGLACSFP